MPAAALGARPASVEGPEFTIRKLQAIAGSSDAGFTTGGLTGEVGQTVDYQIVVTDTGDSRLSFSALYDPFCEGVSPAGETELGPGQAETFNCERLLGAPGTWINLAEIEAGENRKASNEVLVEVPERPEFTVEKLQAIDGTAGGFTTAELLGKVGQTVDYEIIVRDTGNTPLTLAPLQDANCTDISPAGATELTPGTSETFTCQHALTAVGPWTNEAAIEGAVGQRPSIRAALGAGAIAAAVEGGPTRASSNRVVVNVPAEPDYEIEKLQSIRGSAAAFTKAELQGAVGQTVDYRVIVRNTGNQAVRLSPLVDPNCSSVSPSGATELAVGGSETFTCEHTLTGPGSYANEATIEGAGKAKASNRVIVNIPQQQVKAQCAISGSPIELHGASGSKRRTFSVRIPSAGIAQIAFYLDRHRIRTLSAAQTTNGQFEIRIDPGKLRYGAHTVSVRTVMTDSACTAIVRSAVFVRPRPAAVKPKFTG